MLTKSQIKLIKSLSQKKYRNQLGLFCVEGVKGINEFLKSDFVLHQLFATETIFKEECIIISEAELKKISALKTPNKALAIFEIPKAKPVNSTSLIVALDSVRDPGNLGTIIRLCDWFGIHDLVCSLETVDCYNSKVVQATMGSLTRVSINYLDLTTFLEATQLTKFGAFMDGETIYKKQLPDQGIIILGNEAHGISSDIEALVSEKISIPRFGDVQATESLNVATAAAIILSEFRR